MNVYNLYIYCTTVLLLLYVSLGFVWFIILFPFLIWKFTLYFAVSNKTGIFSWRIKDTIPLWKNSLLIVSLQTFYFYLLFIAVFTFWMHYLNHKRAFKYNFKNLKCLFHTFFWGSNAAVEVGNHNLHLQLQIGWKFLHICLKI